MDSVEILRVSQPKRSTMSRTIFALCTLSVLSGCQSVSGPGRVPLTVARLQTVGSCGSLLGGPRRGCEDCVPHPTLAFCYVPWWDNLVTRHTAHECADRALRAYRRQCGRPASPHFKRGFVRAYEDMAMNRRPSPPVIPPPKYWNAYYRSSAGQPFVEDWFDGYETGLEWGCSGGVSQFHEIFLNRSGCGSGSTKPLGYGQTAQGGDYQQQSNEATAYPVQDSNSYGLPGQ